jgi:preprotein translocase subunit SecE
MATKEEPAKKQPRKRKSAETVRERAEKQTAKKDAPSKASKLKGKIHKPLSVLRRVSSKEYHPVPVPDNKTGKVLKKRVRLVPKFVRESWAELKLVTWPTKREAARLTFAVVVFAVTFSFFVQILDYIFNKLIKEILLR